MPPAPFLPVVFILPVPKEVDGLSLPFYRNTFPVTETGEWPVVAESGFHLRCA